MSSIPTDNQQHSKFSPITISAKKNIKRLRLNAGHSMNKGASLLGISRKSLEDIETLRPYGCHLDLELLAKVGIVYSTSSDDIIGPVPWEGHIEYLQRPRKRVGSANRVR